MIPPSNDMRPEGLIRNVAVRKSLKPFLLLGAILAVSLQMHLAAGATRHAQDDDDSADATPKPRHRLHGAATPGDHAAATPKPKPKSQPDDADSNSATPAMKKGRKHGPASPTPKKGSIEKPEKDDSADDNVPAPVGATHSKTGAKATPNPKSKAADADRDADSDTPVPEAKGSKHHPSTPAPKKDAPLKTEKDDSADDSQAAATPSRTKAKHSAEADASATDDAAKATPPIVSGVKAKQTFPSATVASSEIVGFNDQPPRIQRLIEAALELAKLNLTYTYGSADPASGGMDCSGSIYYLLKQQGFNDVPRDASGQYEWARKNGQFFAVISKKAGGFEFSDLLPGDLLFWNGTYAVDRDPPVTHTMIYLGVQKGRKQPIMWGSSDGRSYEGKQRWGVSVFDFTMPKSNLESPTPSKALFLGYARIPGLR